MSSGLVSLLPVRVGFVTCQDLPEPDFDEAALIDGCLASGLDCGLIAWDGPEDPAQFDLLVIRSCWNYHLDVKAFHMWLEAAKKSVPVLNPVDIVLWNSDKHYLADLQDRGLPVVPTEWISFGSLTGVREAAKKLGAEKVVVKPTVSAGSWKTAVFGSSDFVAAEHFLSEILTDRGAMVQPFLNSVKTLGERSVVWVDGQVTHAIVKSPRFTGQDECVSEAVEATEFEKGLVSSVLEPLSERLLYARLDLMQDDNGGWKISELELIEPSLFLVQHPPALARLVEGLTRRKGLI